MNEMSLVELIKCLTFLLTAMRRAMLITVLGYFEPQPYFILKLTTNP
jgi:hypothetical protein